ncbi:MAG: DUF59 domain-containing protein [Tepidisphaeraceae bacterium]
MNSPRKGLNVINPNDKVQQLRDAFAADGAKPQHVAPDAPSSDLEAQVIDAIRTVYDPEIPVNIYDLGLIYGIEIDPENRVIVRMTLTAPGCPVAGDILAAVERKVEAVEAVKSAKVDLVFDPPWTKDRMSEAAMLELGLF